MLLSWMPQEKTSSTINETMGTDEKNVYVSFIWLIKKCIYIYSQNKFNYFVTSYIVYIQYVVYYSFKSTLTFVKIRIYVPNNQYKFTIYLFIYLFILWLLTVTNIEHTVSIQQK